MKQVRRPDQLRREYRREDFGALLRGKYSSRLKQESHAAAPPEGSVRAIRTGDAERDALVKQTNHAQIGAEPIGSHSNGAAVVERLVRGSRT